MIRRRLSLRDKAIPAMREAVRGVIERHKKDKCPLSVWDWKNKKVKYITPAEALRQFKRGSAEK